MGLPSAAVHSDRAHAALELTAVTVIHGRSRLRGRPAKAAVRDVTLTVGRGEIVGLVGESGSGKSTTALAAASLIPITSGTVRVGGNDLTAMRGRALRQARADIQVVFQDAHGSLDPRQSVREGLRELRQVHPGRTGWIVDEELMARVGLTADFLGRLPFEMSGGQAQRVCIARALLLRPQLIVADEPTSALDVSVQAQILRLLKALRDDDGISILFISHDLSLVRAVCDTVYVLHQGMVVEAGATESVLTKPRDEYTMMLIAAIPGKDRHLGLQPFGGLDSARLA